MKTAYVFPGQGSQIVGMGKDSPDQSLLDKANQILGYDLKSICFYGSEDALKQTTNAQPALLTVSYMEYLKQEKKPDMVAGHSLGEYTALCAAGVLKFEDAVRLVHQRGRLMEAAVPAGTGTMAAVLGMEPDVLAELCKKVSGKVEIANYNCPGQIVISGQTAAVNDACKLIADAGKKAIPLSVSGPFHSSLMRPAAEKFIKVLEATEFVDPKIPVIMNVTADYLKSGKLARDLLFKQLFSSVMWEQSIRRMVSDGVEEFVEVGPGKVLTGLVKKIRRG